MVSMGLVIAFSSTAMAAEPAFVELVAPKESTPWMGQRTVFVVEVGVAGRFSGSTVFDLPQVPGAILMQPGDRPVLSARTLDGKEYAVQRHELSLFCQRAGKITIPDIPVRCGAVAAPGQTPSEHTLRVPAFSVTARQPQGVKPGQVVISTTRLDVSETWNPRPGEAIRVGDAFERTITVRATDLPGMLLPTTPKPQLAGVAIYNATPGVDDRMERGEFSGARVETLTYVCESPGKVEIPAVLYRWWHPSNGAWEEKVLPALTLVIAANLDDTTAVSNGAGLVSPDTQDVSWWSRWSWGWLFALVVIGMGGAWAVFLLRREPDAEAQAFRDVLLACRENDATRAYNAWTRWRSLPTVFTAEPPAAVTSELVAAQRLMIGLQLSWNGRELEKTLTSWRRNIQKRKSHLPATRKLPALNPGG
jgi:hypothetical protein